MKKALFLVLDGTLITTLSGRPYSLHREDWKFINQAVAAIKSFASKDYLICILANQKQITDNVTTKKTFEAKMDLVLSTLERDLKLPNESILLEYCVIEDDFNYMPNPGMLYGVAVDNLIQLHKSVLIGNSTIDSQTAINAGIGTYIDVTDLTYPI